jgi:glycosyltransferase involved in cell wall biosynthesis
MRILIVNYEFPPVGGGGANANYYLAREMVRLGHEVTVVTSYFRGLPLSESVEGIRVLRVRLWRRRRDYTKFHEMLQYVAFAIPRLWALCRRERFDLVLCFFAVPSGPAGYVASRVAHAPLVIRLGGGDLPGHDPDRFGTLHRLLGPVVRWLLTRSAARVVNSEGLREKAEALFPGLSFNVIPNGIDLDEFQPPAVRANEPPVILFCSRLIERKGLQFLLPALATLRDEGVPFVLQVVGDGPLRPQLEQQVAELALGEQVQFLGLRGHEELPALYQAADIFVLPSVSEGMPNVVLEAIGCGLPVVGTDVPGMAELVTPGDNGYIVPAGQAQAFIVPLRELLSDADRRRALGQASRARAEKFGWRQLAQAFVNLTPGAGG